MIYYAVKDNHSGKYLGHAGRWGDSPKLWSKLKNAGFALEQFKLYVWQYEPSREPRIVNMEVHEA